MKKKNRLLRIVFIMAFLVSLGLGNELRAATVTFVGSAVDSWGAAGANADWSSGTTPTANDDVIIPTGYTVTTGAAITAKSITIDGNSSLNISQTANIGLAAPGGITLNGTSTLTISAVVTVTVGDATYRGDIALNDNSTLKFTGIATLSMSGTFVKGSDATITETAVPNLTLTGSTDMTLPSTLASIAAFTVNKTGASVYQSANLTVTGAYTLTNGTYVVGDYNFTATGGTTTIATGATFNGSTTQASKTRDFTVVALQGTAVMNLTNSTFDIGTSLTFSPAGATLNITGATVGTNNVTGVNAAVAGTINATGAIVAFDGPQTFTNLTLITDANTDLTFSAGGAIAVPTSVIALKNFTVNKDALATTVTLNSNLSLAGDLTVTQGTFVVTGKTLTVAGTVTKQAVANSIINASGATITFNGPIAFATVATNAGFVTTNQTSLTIGGSGAITFFPSTGGAHTINSLTYNRMSDFTLQATAGTFTFAGTTPAFNITSGKIISAINGNIVDDANTTTTVSPDGTLDLVTFTQTFNGTVTGAGTIDATDAGAKTFSGPYSFTGNLQTSDATVLLFDTHASDVSLNSSVTDLNTLTLNRTAALTLNNNLTFAGASTALTFVNGSIVVNGYTMTLPLNSTADAATWDGIDATASSSMIFTGAAVMANLLVSTDETTNLKFTATPATFPATITECKNLTLETAGVVTLLGNLDIYGNLDVGAGCTFSSSTLDAIVRGDLTTSGTMTLDGVGSSLTLYGSISAADATVFTNNTITELVVLGTSAALQLPSANTATDLTTIGTLTLNRLNGMVINNDLTVGAAAGTVLVITKGDLDLNGYTITLGDAAAVMTETAPYRVINTGASSDTKGYITTLVAGTTNTNLTNSGIGVTSIAAGDGTITIKRYPKVVPIPSVGLAVSRYYQILGFGAAIPSVTFQFDNTELNSPIEGLKLYHSNSDAFTTKTEVSGTLTQNSPTGKGNLAVTGASIADNSFIALAGLPGNGGVMRTFNLASGTSGSWTTAANWSPSGVPTVNDQAVIGPYTVVIEGNGQNFYCSSLLMNHALATLKPFDNGTAGDVVTLNVMGDVNLSADGATIIGANGFGRLNLVIGDGATAGIASTITTPADFAMVGSDGNGIWVNDLTVKSATVTFTDAKKIRVSGDVNVTGNSSMTFKNAGFYGGYNGTAAQEINADNSAYLQFVNMNLENNANVTTASDFEQTNAITVASGSVFNATNGTITYPTGAITCWNVLNGGSLTFNNVNFTGAAGTYSPLGDVTVKGSFTKSGAGLFTATSGSVIFSNSTQKELVNSGLASNLRFYSLQVLPASAVTTSSSFEIASDIDVKTNASFKADNGTISFSQGAPATKWIKNVSTHTLEFNNLAITDGTVYTNDSWTIKGNLSVTAAKSFYANNGTITFENTQEKTITNSAGAAGALEFFKIKLADGSKLTTVTNGFTVKNNATYMTGSGLEVGTNAQFTTGDAAHVTTFDAGVGVTVGNPKTITNNGTLKFGILTIAASPNNEVSTASNFEIIGTNTAFNNAGAGGNFTATAGEITFSGTAPLIASVSPAVTNFYSIASKGNTILALTTAQDIHVRGNITINGASSFAPQTPASSKIIFDGTTQQFIGGNTSVIDGINLGNVVLNKGNASYTTDDEVKLTANVYNSGVLTLTNGILNLGSSTFKCAAATISRANGVINGGTGTYQITTNHVTTKLEDAYFTIGGTPTLYNLLVDLGHTTANDLTVNGNLNLNVGTFTIASGTTTTPKWLKVKGNLLRTAGIIDGDESLSTLILEGNGTVIGGLSNLFFGGVAATVNLEIGRAEVLGGNLTMAAGTNDLAINTGINSFDLAAYTLNFQNTGNTLTLKSGAIKAASGSKVVLASGALDDIIPANTFVNNELYNLTIAAQTTIKSDLTINGTWEGAFSIITGENVLATTKTAVIPTLTVGSYVRGNLKRVVTNIETVFPVGDGVKAINANNYRPISLQFATIGNEQAITVRTTNVDPTIGRGGNPKNAVNLVWNITPEGTDANDALKVKFQWPSDAEEAANGGQVSLANASFPAKWTGSAWQDYRNNLSNYAVASPRVLTMSSFAVANPAALKGDWAVFNATANTNASKDEAIATNKNRLVITTLSPNPVVTGQPFKVIAQLQDQFGQPITSTTEYSVTLSKHQGVGTFTSVVGVIPAGSSLVTFNGLTFSGSTGQTHQLLIDTTGGSSNWQSGLSPVFSVLPTVPATQASNIRFANIAPTSMTITWLNPADADNNQRTIVMMKANGLLSDAEFPVNGTTYVANSVYGAGTSIGEAVVVYNGNAAVGTDNSINVTGLAPNTKYYAYAFVYSMDDNTEGSENYKTTAASKNPNAETTIGGTDDDVAFGTNNTRATSKTIGTNTPVTATINSSTDEDWFNFTVTGASPNVRTQLSGLANNYNIEVYDASGRRIRRGIRTATGSEGPVVNDLPAGTYTVRIYSADGSYSATNTYTLKVGTKSSEIFSVTP